MGVACVSGSGKDVKTESQLTDPSESLIVEGFENACLDTIQSDVAMNVVKDDFFEFFCHVILLFGISREQTKSSRSPTSTYAHSGPRFFLFEKSEFT